MTPALPTAAHRTRSIPDHSGTRLDAIHAALASLGEESRRLQRLGFELPLARCQAQQRYWSFLQALYSLPGELSSRPSSDVTDGETPWR